MKSETHPLLKIAKKARVTSVRVTLFYVLLTLFIVMITSAIALWVVAYSNINASGPMSEVTFSSVLATDEALRMIYSAWLAFYFIVSIFLLFLVIYEPMNTPHKYDTHNSCRVSTAIWFYYLFFCLKFVGLTGVLLFPVTNPAAVLDHYISALLAFGSAIGTSWILWIQRWNYKDDILFKRRFGIPGLLMWWNFIYCFTMTVVAVWFVVESFELDYFKDKGYVEFAITLFCVVDRLWELFDFYNDDIYIRILNEKNLRNLKSKKT